ncbi:hypothetical protein CRUP_036845 [Coryphaenoides rupestris]|nr:hypothetical protein CRUP_036845 [Coryphaenoides rupestris]
MSGFSAELIDYLEGRITFEEFDRRREEREEREATQSGGKDPGEEDAEEDDDDDDAQPSTSAQCHGKLGMKYEHEQHDPRAETAETSSDDDDDADDDEEEEETETEKGEGGAAVEGGRGEEAKEDGDTMTYVDDLDDKDLSVGPRRGGAGKGKRKSKSKAKKDEEEEGGGGGDGGESPTVGDIFALEMELNRENRKMMRERRHRSKLPRALRGLMGEANIRYARGEKDDAIVMCMEIIRQAPLAYEPFSTLAMIYEDNGDVDKALQFGLIAAHLNPSDCEEWVKLADMSLERDNVRQAIICYSKAIRHDPTNVRYLWERSSLYMRVGEHKHDDLPSALGVTEEALKRHPELVNDELINMAAELYLAGHQHRKALQVLMQYSGIVLVRRAPEPAPEPALEPGTQPTDPEPRGVKEEGKGEEVGEGEKGIEEKGEGEKGKEGEEMMEGEKGKEGEEMMEGEKGKEGEEMMEGEKGKEGEEMMEEEKGKEGEGRKVGEGRKEGEGEVKETAAGGKAVKGEEKEEAAKGEGENGKEKEEVSGGGGGPGGRARGYRGAKLNGVSACTTRPNAPRWT